MPARFVPFTALGQLSCSSIHSIPPILLEGHHPGTGPGPGPGPGLELHQLTGPPCIPGSTRARPVPGCRCTLIRGRARCTTSWGQSVQLNRLYDVARMTGWDALLCSCESLLRTPSSQTHGVSTVFLAMNCRQDTGHDFNPIINPSG
jgi:hypothetical protein